MLAKPALSGLMLTSLSILLLLTAVLTTPPAARPLSSASGISAWEDLVVGTNTFGNAIATDGFYLYSIGGEIYLTGGSTATVQRYDPTLNAWTNRTSLPIGIADTAACYMHGRIYLPGGNTSSGKQSQMRIYDVSANIWITGTASPDGGFSNASVVCDPVSNQVYVIGGINSTGTTLNLVRVYLTLADLWRPDVANLPAARSSATAGLLAGSKIVVAGGLVGGAPSSDVQIYDIAANSWSLAPALSVARQGAAGSVGPDGKFYVAGGLTIDLLDSVEIYDPLANSWAASDHLLHPVGAVQGAFINRRLYVISGQGVEKDGNCTLQPSTGRAMCNYNQMLDIAGR